MQVGVKEEWGAKYGDNWVSVDKFDYRDFVDYHYDVQHLMFEDQSFGAVACLGVLNFVENPQKAISELVRVLKPGGEIWIQAPMCFYPIVCKEEGKWHDYWRVSPAGMRLLMGDTGIEEVACGTYAWTRSSLAISTFYYGKKRGPDQSA